MMRKYNHSEHFGLSPIQILVLGYLFFTFLFTGLLMLPTSSVNHQSQSFADALFMSSSGISTTGLATVDVGSYYTLFGQIVMLLDFQIGGIGYMALFVMFYAIIRRRLSLQGMLVGEESMAGASMGSTKPFFIQVLWFTLLFELTGGVLLGLCFLNPHAIARSLFYGLFHSISAFCTAGFSLFPDSLIGYRYNIPVNLIINILSLAGGIEFIVMSDLMGVVSNFRQSASSRRPSLHSRLVLSLTTALILSSTLLILLAGGWDQEPMHHRIILASFQVISASTTDGFNSVDINAMSSIALAIIIFLMFVGASPGSTGGGIKTTTLGIVLLATRTQLRGQQDCNVLGRRIATGDIAKAFAIMIIALLVFFLVSFVLSLTETGTFMQICFECMSALGNTGLSMGITANLTTLAKIILSITMFVGRVGPLTIGMAVFMAKQPAKIRFAAEEVYVG